ncbi:helix-turn-helix domain-containing protein [Streptomyces sp. DSM 42041]|uniref:Helix-turn-helix domain-containing protein n=1 Tax=Streptomyces hazeniae TaxID=3075538 RepID=A0ABU2NZ33_9ACTN|nr:helix-turn-helix domain-containing protein [Streptomyces sp. DSM 42041]MDT0382246.1 helix-turn-helix domain-containing protein [Streptomyces sp. DSM 42041]
MSIGNAPEAPEEDRPSVGRALQKARIDARLTVEEVSTSTRVRVPIVHAIEDDDFSRCGGDVYARGHVRTLARAVGLDADALVAQYDAEHGGRPEPTPAATLFEAERIRPEPRRPNWTAAMVAAIVAVVGFVGFTLFTGEEGGNGSQVAQEEPAEKPDGDKPDAKPEQKKPSKPEPKPSESAIAGVPADKVTVRMEADDGNSWISATDHTGKLIFEGVLNEGDTKTFTDDEQLDLVFGNAGAVKLWVNGKEVDRLGEVGTVERVTYTRGDPEQG